MELKFNLNVVLHPYQAHHFTGRLQFEIGEAHGTGASKRQRIAISGNGVENGVGAGCACQRYLDEPRNSPRSYGEDLVIQ